MRSDPSTRIAEQHLLGFLDDVGGVPADKKADFLRAIAAVPPTDVERVYWQARVTLLRRLEDLDDFDRVFTAWFVDEPDTPVGDDVDRDDEPDDDEQPAPDHPDDASPSAVLGEGTGVEASRDHLTASGTFPRLEADRHRLVAELRTAWPDALPRVSGRRWRSSSRGPRLDARRTARLARRTAGEIVDLTWQRRPERARPLLLLIDVSGSMEDHTADLLRVAQAAVTTCRRVQAYTFGTRLTRVTEPLAHDDVDVALDETGDVVDDVHGGTRIGAAFEAFLADPHDLARARGALVVVASDGLERGDCASMVASTRRLARLSHRLVWWSPLACHPAYRPITAGMSGILGWLDHLGGVRDLASAVDEVRALAEVVAGPRRRAGHPVGRAAA